MSILVPFIIITIACLIIWRACDGFETASEYLGRNLSDGVRGATINAIGSSIPEFFTTLLFLFVLKDQDGFSGGLGTTAGSAVFNGVIIPAFVVLTVTAFGIAKAVKLSKKVVLRDGIGLILCDIVLIIVVGGSVLHWWHGLILTLLYVIYLIYMFSTMEKGASSAEEDDDEEETEGGGSIITALLTLDLEHLILNNKAINAGRAWTLLLLATGVIGFACYFLVHACENLGHALNVPIYFVAVIIAAAATSVPDTILSIKDAMKGQYDDALSNALGSNIFDISFALGFPLLLFTLINGSITMAPETVQNVSELLILLLLITIGTFLIFYVGDKIGKLKAYLLISLYAIFLLFVLGRAMDNPIAASFASVLRMINGWFDVLRVF